MAFTLFVQHGEGILSNTTRVQAKSFAPPLTVEKKDLEWVIEQAADVLGATSKV